MTRTATFRYDGAGFYSAELRDQDGAIEAVTTTCTLPEIIRWAREQSVTLAPETGPETSAGHEPE